MSSEENVLLQVINIGDNLSVYVIHCSEILMRTIYLCVEWNTIVDVMVIVVHSSIFSVMLCITCQLVWLIFCQCCGR